MFMFGMVLQRGRKSALPHGAVGTEERRRDSQMEEFSR